MILIIDTATTSLDYDQLTQIDGVEYLFRFVWAVRESCYYMSIFDQDENALAVGIKLVINTNLLRKYQTDPRLPTGWLICLDETGTDTDIINAPDLGVRVPLYYFTADEVLAARQTAASVGG